MTSTYDVLLERLQAAFDRVAPGADPVLRQSERGDYQANGEMSLAKQVGRPPRDVAEEIVGLVNLDEVATVEIAGPGFLNLTISPPFLNTQLRTMLGDARLGVAVASPAKKSAASWLGLVPRSPISSPRRSGSSSTVSR